MKWVGLIAAVLLLLACSSAPPVWRRVDGSMGNQNEFAHDHAICSDLGDVGGYRACMTEHGWVVYKPRRRLR
jgi:hypothetical protein